jgi:hypothetical protein
MVMILSSSLVVASFSFLWANLDQAEAFQPGRAFLARTPQQHQHQHQHQHFISTSTTTTLLATTPVKAENATETAKDWIADEYELPPPEATETTTATGTSTPTRSNSRATGTSSVSNIVVGPSQMLIYDTSLRGT